MKEWFLSDPLRAVLYILAVPSTFIMLLQTILIFIGMAGSDGDMDVPDVHIEGNVEGVFGDDCPDVHDFSVGDSGLRVFTVRGIVAFFAVGGWAGLSAYSLTNSPAVTILTALIFGILALITVALFFKWAASLHSNGAINMDNALGKTGEVYITVPASMSGIGKVNVIIQQRLTEAEAVTKCNRPLKYGERVKVVAVSEDNTLTVEPLDDNN